MTQENKKDHATSWSAGFYTTHTTIHNTVVIVKDRKKSLSSMEDFNESFAFNLTNPPQSLQPETHIPQTGNTLPVRGKTRRLGERKDSEVVNIPTETHWYDCLPCCGKK